MKQWLLAAALAALLPSTGPAPAARVPVLVELYTSEGCSSCPPADALLEALQREQPVEGAEVIPIGLHVDYFNHLGWKDTFSSSSYTRRQQAYSPVFGNENLYTPQMVVDGDVAIPGTESDLIRRAIASAAVRSHLPIRVSAAAAAGKVDLKIDLPAAPAATEKIEVVIAITQDGLTTMVKSGENKGRTLHHVAVTRDLRVLDPLSAKTTVVEKQLPIAAAWGPDNLKALVWLQGAKSRQVYGAATAAISR